MVVMEGTVDTAAGVAVAMKIPGPQERTVSNTLRSNGRVINTDPFEMGF
jgi:hypothetical protein